MKHSIVILAALLAGCSTVGQFENRVVCTMAKDKAFLVSEYGPVGISAVVADADRVVICPPTPTPAAPAPLPAASAAVK